MKGDVEEIRARKDGESLVNYYLSESDEGKAYGPKTKDGYRTSWSTYTDWAEGNDLDLADIEKEEAIEYKKHLLDKLNGESPSHYFGHVSKIIAWLTETEEADFNPFANVRPPEQPKTTSKMEVGLDELRKAVLDARNRSIVLFVYLVIALKTGLRASEIANLDLRDIHLDHPISKVMPDPRREIYNYPDTLYVDSAITKGEVHNGEERKNGNKKRSTRQVPIDEELKSVLVWWIGMLPPTTSPAKPLMRKINDPDGERYTKDPLQKRVKQWTRSNNLNSSDMKHFGVDSHWCRHWFTTTLRARIDPDEVPIGSPAGYVEGLRGDSSDSVIETYTHEWSELTEGKKAYREVYEDNIPQLFVSGDED